MIDLNFLKIDNIKAICKSKWCFYLAFVTLVTVIACLIVLWQSNHIQHKNNTITGNTKQETIKSNSQTVKGNNDVITANQ